RDVDAQARVRGDRIDEVPRQRPEARREREVVALAVAQPPAERVHVEAGERGHAIGTEARRVDDGARTQRGDLCVRAPDRERPPVAGGLEPLELGAVGERGAVRARLARIAGAERMDVDDAALWREQRREGGDAGLEPASLARVEERERADAVL